MVLFCFRIQTFVQTKGEIWQDNRHSLCVRVDGLFSSRFWCMNEDGHHMSEFIWSFLIILLYGLFPLFSVVYWTCVSSFIAEMGIKFSTAKLPLRCKLHFQDAPACLQASSTLELTLSLFLSLACRRLMLKSHSYIRYFSMSFYRQSFSLTLLLKDISLFCTCSFSQISPDSDHGVLTATTPWAVRLDTLRMQPSQTP